MMLAVLGILGVTAVGLIHLSLLLEKVVSHSGQALENQRQILAKLDALERKLTDD